MANLDTIVFKVEWSWEDVILCMVGEERKAFWGLPLAMQNRVIGECNHTLHKCMESGIMNGWNDVLRVAIDEAKVPETIKRMESKLRGAGSSAR